MKKSSVCGEKANAGANSRTDVARTGLTRPTGAVPAHPVVAFQSESVGTGTVT